jgi:hypothetical protein
MLFDFREPDEIPESEGPQSGNDDYFSRDPEGNKLVEFGLRGNTMIHVATRGYVEPASNRFYVVTPSRTFTGVLPEEARLSGAPYSDQALWALSGIAHEHSGFDQGF